MDYKYWAFLSYSHQDNLRERADGTKGCIRWAEWLHESLETWKVPAEFRSRQTRTGEPMPERFNPAFQDEKELPLNSDLASSIRTALEQSRFLIVICSPRSAHSFYVNEEVRYFKQLGRLDRILALIVDGEPNASDGNKSGVSVEQECFCPALRHPLDLNGNVDPSRRDSQEPIAGDVRVKSGEHPREAREHDMKVHREVIDFMKLKLIAGLMGVGFDELAQRDKARAAGHARARVRRLAVLAGAFAVLGVAAIVAAVFAFVSRNAAIVAQDKAIVAQGKAVAAQNDAVAQKEIASQQRDLAKTREKEVRERLANLYEEKGRQALTEGDPATAAPYLVEAWKTYPERPELQLLVGMALQPLQGQRLILRGNSPVRWSPDGKTIASADNGSVRLWDASQGRAITSFKMDTSTGFGQNILSLFFTPDSDQLIATNDHGSIALLKLATPTVPPIMLTHSFYSVYATLSGDGKLLATVGMGGMNTPGQEVNIWQLPEGTNLSVFGDGEGKSACFSREGKRLLVTSADGAVRVWDWAAKTVDLDLKGDGPMAKAIFVQDDKFIVGTGEQNLLTWWDATSGARTQNVKPDDLNSKLTSLEISADKRLLFTASLTEAAVTDLQTQPVQSHALQLPIGSLILNNAHLSPDGKFVVICPTSGRYTAIWDAATGNSVAPLVGQQGDIYDAAFSPDGRQVAVAGRDGHIVVWDWPQVTIPPPIPEHNIPVLKTCFGTTDRIITATFNTIRLWSESNGNLVKEIQHPVDPSVGVSSEIRWTASLDGLHLATAGGDKMVRIYNGVTGEPGAVLPNESPGAVLDFSPDGTLLCTGGWDGAVRVWNVAAGTQKIVLSRKFHNLDQVHFDLSGNRLLVLDQNDAPAVWDVVSNRQRVELKAEGVSQETGTFSPDGTYVFTGGSDRQVRAWNTDTGKLAFIMGPFVDRLSLVEFSPDGKILALFAGGGTVFFYDANTGKPLCQWDTPSRAPVSSIRFWPNSHFAALTVFQSLYFFDSDAGQLLAKYQGEGHLSNIHFTPDGTRVLVSQDKSARIIPLFHLLKDPDAAAEEVDRLDRWKLVDGHLVAK